MITSFFKLKELVIQALQYNFTLREKEQVFFSLISHYGSVSKIDFLINSSSEVSEELEGLVLSGVMSLNKGMPLQYVTGVAYFRELEIEVNKNVLIPRPETEELVSLCLRKIKPGFRILDLGTGSGCIPLSIKSEFPQVEIIGIDISEEALEVAKKNALNLNLDVAFLQRSISESLQSLGCYDVVISNPPYIGKVEEKDLEKHVVKHEPHIALFSPTEDALFFYKEIFQRTLEILVSGGYLFLELHENYASETCEVFKTDQFEDVEILSDLQGKLRFLKARKV